MYHTDFWDSIVRGSELLRINNKTYLIKANEIIHSYVTDKADFILLGRKIYLPIPPLTFFHLLFLLTLFLSCLYKKLNV
jgi:hypothetical protein